MPVLLQHIGHQPCMLCRVPSSSSPTPTWKQKHATLAQICHSRRQTVPSSSRGPRNRYLHVKAQAAAAAAALPAVAASVADASGPGVPGQELKWWRQPLRCWKEWWDLKNHVSHFRACKCMGKNCSCLSQNTKRDLHVQTADKPRPPARKLSAIAHKLWQVLRVNKLLLAVAILTMVTSSLLPLQLVPLTGTKCTMPH